MGKVKEIEDFKDECELKWQYDENKDKMYVKINGKEHDEHVHDESNNKCKVCVHKIKIDKFGKNCSGVIGMFTKGLLRITNDSEEFHGSCLT